MLYVLLLLVVAHAATISCPAGEDDQVTNGTCAPCVNGEFKAAAGQTDCTAKQVDAGCAAKKRAAGANSDAEKTKDDGLCAEACDAGYAVATADVASNSKTADCKDFCAAGFGGAACAACTVGTNFSAGAAVGTVCTAVQTCDAKFATAPFAKIAATASTDLVCGCVGGKSGAECADACDAGKFLVEGDNTGKSKADCAAYTVCKGTTTAKADNNGVDQWGTKTAGTASADAVCNLEKPAAAASSAAVLAIPAFLIALLF